MSSRHMSCSPCVVMKTFFKKQRQTEPEEIKSKVGKIQSIATQLDRVYACGQFSIERNQEFDYRIISGQILWTRLIDSLAGNRGRFDCDKKTDKIDFKKVCEYMKNLTSSFSIAWVGDESPPEEVAPDSGHVILDISDFSSCKKPNFTPASCCATLKELAGTLAGLLKKSDFLHAKIYNEFIRWFDDITINSTDKKANPIHSWVRAKHIY